MANRKISDLAALTAPATGDLLPIVDISEAAAADKNKKITFGELLSSAPAGSAAAPSFSFDADPNTGIFNPAADTLAFAEGGTEIMRLDPSGRLLVGTSTANTSGAKLQTSDGLTFPATQVASANPNTLDDYEEGTWTPTDASGAGLTLTVTTAKYIKIGRIVILQAGVVYPVTADGSGLKIAGLPFNNIAGTLGCGFSAYVNGAAPGLVFRSQDISNNIFATNVTDQDNQPSNATFSGREIQFAYIYQV